MKKLIVSLFAYLLFCASVAFGDVTVIQSVIIGAAYKTYGQNLIVINPVISFGETNYELAAGKLSATYVCAMIGAEYVDYDGETLLNKARRVSPGEHGGIGFVYNDRKLSVATCRSKEQN